MVLERHPDVLAERHANLLGMAARRDDDLARIRELTIEEHVDTVEAAERRHGARLAIREEVDA